MAAAAVFHLFFPRSNKSSRANNNNNIVCAHKYHTVIGFPCDINVIFKYHPPIHTIRRCTKHENVRDRRCWIGRVGITMRDVTMTLGVNLKLLNQILVLIYIFWKLFLKSCCRTRKILARRLCSRFRARIQAGARIVRRKHEWIQNEHINNSETVGQVACIFISDICIYFARIVQFVCCRFRVRRICFVFRLFVSFASHRCDDVHGGVRKPTESYIK